MPAVGEAMNEREKLLQQMRKLRSQIDPRILSAVQKLAEAQFGALFGGRGGPPSRAAKVPPPPQILPPTAPGPGDEPIDGR
ncbi:MAG: hypothetical protein FJX47_08245, partial [Alphaproteobacteria bacterium]|nr:hypothetical protein [Alphaproteobacteria bacterium]